MSTPTAAVPGTFSTHVLWRVLDAGLAAFGVTTGVLITVGRARGGALAAFAAVGRRVARDIALPGWGEAALGLVVHAGQCMALGALMVLVLGRDRVMSRVRAALLVVLAWELAARLPWLMYVRVDMASALSPAWRIGLAALLAAALAIAPRRAS